jgi:hypothetical protein
MSDDRFIEGIKSNLADTKSHLEALETGHFSDGATEARITSFKQSIAIYEAILAQAKKS